MWGCLNQRVCFAPEEQWIEDWAMLARRYRHCPYVVGFDLRNEARAGRQGGVPPPCRKTAYFATPGPGYCRLLYLYLLT